MRRKSKVWSRAVLLLVAGVWVETKACAESPEYSRVLLNKGDEAVLAAPEAWFAHEVGRIKVPPSQFTAKAPEGEYAQHTAEAELSDLRTALRRLNVSKDQLDQTVEAHRGERAKLSRFMTNSPQIVAGLPGEFADYFRGSIAWNKGDHATASYKWRELLTRPASERQFKSTWATYMLGQLNLTEEPDRAIEHFQQVRSLAEAGFADSTGLAAASIGWEAKAHFAQRRFAKAIELYLQARDSLSLKWVAAQASAQADAGLVANPLVRRVITAWVISREQWPEEQDKGRAGWLELVEKQKELGPDEPEVFALAAYQNRQFEAAQRWIKRAQSTPVTQWLQAKLYVRAGKISQAIAILSQLATSFPRESKDSDESGHETLAGNIFIRAGYYGTHVEPARHITGELGVLHLAKGSYIAALDSFLKGGFWMDAAYVAERVLTVEELKTFVDRALPEKAEATDAVDVTPSGTREAIRYLLARRLVRLCLPAREYFPPERRGKYDELMANLKRGETESLPPEERAAGWWEGAKMIRQQGLALIGTELEPDWHIRDGNSLDDVGVTVSARATNAQAKVIVASADELNRARRHKADPEARFHYRYQAAFIALQAASLLPDNSDEKARILCTAGSWLKAQDAITADIFYKYLVRRCRKTALGNAADVMRWFPTQDANGDLQPVLPITTDEATPEGHPEPETTEGTPQLIE